MFSIFEIKSKANIFKEKVAITTNKEIDLSDLQSEFADVEFLTNIENFIKNEGCDAVMNNESVVDIDVYEMQAFIKIQEEVK